MTKRIFRAIFLVAILVLVASMAVIGGVLSGYLKNMEKNALSQKTELIGDGVERFGEAYLRSLKTEDNRVTWIDSSGKVLFDSSTDASKTENQADCEEVKEALLSGGGESERYSETHLQKTLYRAIRLSDGTVLRISVLSNSGLVLALGVMQPAAAVFVAALIVSLVLSNQLAKRISEPLEKLDLEHPLENDTYDELSSLLTRIDRQQHDLRERSAELEKKDQELSAVTNHMAEGLMLLSEKDTILYINPAALTIFSANPSCVGENVLTVCRNTDFQGEIEKAGAGKSAEAMLSVGGRQFQLNINPVFSEKNVSGICVLAFDVTDRLQSESIRREFSANVSHELKTPLHTIMGAAELIENGIAENGAEKVFAQKIRFESQRLLTLINDVIRLSQLDESQEFEKEDVSLSALCEEVAESLSAQAAEKNVVIRTSGDAFVFGVKRLLYEIVFNLCDNAVRYNKIGGKVDMQVQREEDSVSLTVSDTGIGIPPEAQDRVFERFFRVDKSHSRETGGTGLGLSIVKHAAQYHGADVSLKSTPGVGTEICVRFPNRLR